MRAKKQNAQTLKVGLVDADLLDNGTRHPNLVLLKIAGFLHDNSIPFHLILDQDEDISKYDRIFLSRVFSFTSMPAFFEKAKGTKAEKIFATGGTGFYVDKQNVKEFSEERNKDMNGAPNALLPSL